MWKKVFGGLNNEGSGNVAKIRVEKELYKLIEEGAMKAGLTVEEFVEKALKLKMKRVEGGEKP